MTIISLNTTQKLTNTPSPYTANDSPSGTYAATKLILPDTSPAAPGGKILITENQTSEEAIIIGVLNGTEIFVEELANSYTSLAYVTFLGRTNPGDPNGTTLVKNSTGIYVHGTKNKAETFFNKIASDVFALAWDLANKEGSDIYFYQHRGVQ